MSTLHVYSLRKVSVGPILEEDMTLTVFNGRAVLFTVVSMTEQIVYFVAEEELVNRYM